MKNPNKKLPKILIAIFLVIILSAFGCKNTDDQTAATEEITTDTSATEVTFTPPEPTTTDTTTDTATKTTTDTTSTDSSTDDTISNIADTSGDISSILTPTSDTTSISEADTTTDSADTITTSNNQAPTTDVTSSTSTDEEEVIKLGKVLAEIYGTFTNKDLEPFKNLQNLKTYSSENMNKWIDNKVASYQASESISFYGITTKAVSAGVLDSSSTDYQILVTCEREEINESSQSPNKYFQLVEINFVKSGGDWLLDSAYWQ